MLVSVEEPNSDNGNALVVTCHSRNGAQTLKYRVVDGGVDGNGWRSRVGGTPEVEEARTANEEVTEPSSIVAGEQTAVRRRQVEDTESVIAARVPRQCLGRGWVERSKLVAVHRVNRVAFARVDRVVRIVAASVGCPGEVRGVPTRVHRSESRGGAEVATDVYRSIGYCEREDARVHAS